MVALREAIDDEEPGVVPRALVPPTRVAEAQDEVQRYHPPPAPAASGSAALAARFAVDVQDVVVVIVDQGHAVGDGELRGPDRSRRVSRGLTSTSTVGRGSES